MNLTPLFPNIRARKPRTTRAFRLTASSLINTAIADIIRKRLNIKLSIGHYHELAFDPRDVRHTDLPAGVIQRVLKRARKRPRYRQGNRARLYSDIQALRAALRMAEL